MNTAAGMSQTCEGLVLQPSVALLSGLSSGSLTLSVFDAQGGLVWQQPDALDALQDLGSLLPLDDESQWRQPNGGLWRRRLPCGRVLFICVVPRAAAAPPALLCLEYRDGDADRMPPEAVSAALADLGRLLADHYALNSEVVSMADELLRRYEELNLVYNTSEDAAHFDEGATILNQIVQNCTGYLDVDATAFVLFERDMTICAARPGMEGRFSGETVRPLASGLASWLRANDDSLVVNNTAEAQSNGVEVPPTLKLIATPVRDAKGRMQGLLMVVSNESRADFENGDRNLLGVMAEKASKIVRANYDALTGLMSRESFERTVRNALPGSPQSRDEACMLHINIDQLHLVNDTLGHHIGDDLIRRIANVLRSSLRGDDRLARLGGDDFGILLQDCSVANAQRMAERLRASIAELDCYSGTRQLNVSISVGLAPLGGDLDTVIGVMAAADLACTAAKDEGRNRVYLYMRDDANIQQRRKHMHWVGTIQRAVKDDRFVLFCQTIEPTRPASNEMHYEILLRMLGDDDEILSPGVFMPVAERYHMMPSIDRWVISASIRALSNWYAAGNVANAVFAINLSGQTITDNETLDFIVAELNRSAFDPTRICFEITETAAISNVDAAQQFIARVKALGCRFALDDFGAGVSSFSSLRQLDVDYLKIDGSFVRDMNEDPVSAAMVAAINQVGKTMKLDTVAEFVESAEIGELLTGLGVDYLQGYHIAKPRPLSELLADISTRAAQSA